MSGRGFERSGAEAHLQVDGERHDDGGHHEVSDRERSDVPERIA